MYVKNVQRGVHVKLKDGTRGVIANVLDAGLVQIEQNGGRRKIEVKRTEIVRQKLHSHIHLHTKISRLLNYMVC